MSRRDSDPWARFAEAMTPRASLTDEGWQRLQARLRSEPDVASPLEGRAAEVVRLGARVPRTRWVVAVALAAAAVAAMSMAWMGDASQQVAEREPSSQAVDRRTDAATGGTAVVREVNAPAELPRGSSAAPPTSSPPPSVAVRPSARVGAPTPPAAPAPSADRLAAEVALLDRIERALAAEHVDAARRLLAQYQREIPSGAMAREAAMLGIVIACHDGTSAGIEAAVHHYVTAYPSDAAVARLRAEPCASSSSTR